MTVKVAWRVTAPRGSVRMPRNRYTAIIERAVNELLNCKEYLNYSI